MRHINRRSHDALHIGLLPEEMTSRAGDIPVWLDRPLGLFADAGTRMTYADLADRIDDLSARLHAAGIGAGDQVVLHKTNNIDLILLACAIARRGALPILLSALLDASTVRQMLARLDRPRLLTDSETLAGTLAGLPPGLISQPVLVTDSAAGAVSLAELAGSPRLTPVRPDPEAPALVTHTSGTTGVPKLAVQTGRSLLWQLLPQSWLFQVLRFHGSMAMCVSPTHARMFSAIALLADFRVRSAFLIDPGPQQVGPLLAEFRPEGLEAHPNIFVRWEELCDAPDDPLARVRLFINGFDAAHPRTIGRLLAASRRRLPIYAQGYGQTEIGLVTGRLYTRRSVGRADGRCVGVIWPGITRVRVAPADGGKVSATSPGFIEARSRGRCLTYLGQEERYRGQLHDGEWWQMGDMGYLSRFRCLHLLDREIDRGTGLHSNLAVEDQLMRRLDQLTEAVLVPDAEGRPVPVVCTKGDRPLDLAEWRRATADLPPMAAPLHIRWEDLPVTSTWKVRRPALTAMVQASELATVE